ncbi:FAD dependent oxidoreductase [Cordyceps militaris CM01]|uniref:FAD dependent oxidoreductase n=1 Tax=Cordyceps militaris (strain CM01) TaxID=983644 RepID=G3J344_CORMM|nr:FAD dependent oxidoreductase [Cordyceps militaris CM01]EGX95627.1 FAD dependent oxidoreductase [Cordyceps militaris CM01]
MTQTKLQEGQAELPTAESTHSYWHQDPSPALLGHRTTKELPASADVVVVGSGITGAFAARTLVEAGRSVLMLEAREACWGATGRNGGHCHPLVFISKPNVAQFELDNYFYMRDFVRAHQVPCDWESVGAVCRLSTDTEAQAAQENVRLLRRHHPALADKVVYVEDVEELKRLRVPGARAAVVHPHAAKLWPYKLVAWVLEALLGTNDQSRPAGVRFNLQTTTPATHLQRFGTSWVLHTPRGQVVAKQVLLATNGYTSHLLPRMSALIRPMRGQVAALVPPAGYAPLEHTHIWGTPAEADDYLAQRPDGVLILGGERSGEAVVRSQTSRDDELDGDVSARLRRAAHGVIDLRPGEEESEELRAVYEWTGIMGYSADGHPWVGEVPAILGGGGGGLFVSAGYTGHGMPAAARSGVAAANMMLGRGTGDVRLPREFAVTPERVRTAPAVVLPETWEDEIRMNAFWIEKEDEVAGEEDM